VVPVDIGRRGQRHLRRCPQARHGRSQIVRDVVERAAHPRDEPFNLVEHGVEERRQLVDGISLLGERDARVSAARRDDALNGGDELTDWLER